MNTIYGYHFDTPLHRIIISHENQCNTYVLAQHLKDGYYVPDYFKRYYCVAGTWAIFHAEGEKIENLWNRIYKEWIPFSKYEIRDKYILEFNYGNRYDNKIRSEIMIPIKEKKARRTKKRYVQQALKERISVDSKYHIEKYVYKDSLYEPLQTLYKEVTKKYPDGIYWSWDPRVNEGMNVFLCYDNDKLIGKAHAMIFEKQEDDAPGYAEHRIFMHYRALPEYENDEVLDLLFDAAYDCALELRKQLSNRVCELCIGNKSHEVRYNEHAKKKGFPEYGSIFHLEADTKEIKDIEQVIDSITVERFYLDSSDIIRELVVNDQCCFRDTISSYENYQDIAQGDYLAFGAFVIQEDGTRKLVGSVITEFDSDRIPEIIGAMVLPQYQRKHLASIMLQYTLDTLHKNGYKKTWLVTQCVNTPAINLYTKHGFHIYAREVRFMKYI